MNKKLECLKAYISDLAIKGLNDEELEALVMIATTFNKEVKAIHLFENELDINEQNRMVWRINDKVRLSDFIKGIDLDGKSVRIAHTFNECSTIWGNDYEVVVKITDSLIESIVYQTPNEHFTWIPEPTEKWTDFVHNLHVDSERKESLINDITYIVLNLFERKGSYCFSSVSFESIKNALGENELYIFHFMNQMLKLKGIDLFQKNEPEPTQPQIINRIKNKNNVCLSRQYGGDR